MLKNIGITELVVVAVILMFLFGSKRLPELAKGVRKSSEEFRKGLTDEPTKKDTDQD